MSQKKYYSAYDDRYRQVHQQGLQWFSGTASPIVMETMESFGITQQHRLLEVGCGEGRDAYPLLKQGFNLLATDVSPEAISFCKDQFPDYAEHFQVLDCIAETIEEKFHFIYAVAVLHMLVPDEDRNKFYHFVRAHLSDNGIALICTMGDGTLEFQTDISAAFDIQERTHGQSGKRIKVAATSCRPVTFPTFERELQQKGLTVLRQGLTAVEPDFPQMMYAVVNKA
jgi:SAM-dependent methyltransferase